MASSRLRLHLRPSEEARALQAPPLFEAEPVEQLRHALREAFDQSRLLESSTERDLVADLRWSNQRVADQQLMKPDNVFFDNWFVERYFFLFRKNLTVTNIQFAELFALLRTHVSYDEKYEAGRASSPQLQLLSRADFRALIGHVLRDISRMDDTNKAIDFAATTFLDVFDRTILVGQFYGSCAIYLPPHIKLDLGLICGESGYIHSCGHLVYLRNVEKARRDSFVSKLQDHLAKHYTSGQRAALIPYSHEAFTKTDEHERDMLTGGLDDVKIHTTKYFIGTDSLVDVLADLEDRMGDRLWIPDPGAYATKHDLEKRRAANGDVSRTIWILSDREISSVPLTVRASERYLIVYDQLYANKNRYHEFDENKPGWIDHTTLPHTLTGAMINITRPWDSNDVLIGDPFAGSGTTLFEALKLPRVTAICADSNPVAEQVVADNRAFFSQPLAWLRDYRAELKSIESEVGQFDRHNRRRNKSPLQTRYEWAARLVNRCVRADGDPIFAPKDVTELTEADLKSRLLFYLLLKAERRNTWAFKSGDASWLDTVSEQARWLGERVDALLRIDEGPEQDDVHAPEEAKPRSHLRFVQTRYSVGIATRPPAREAAQADLSVMRKAKADEFAAECDVIVTDPPYGFNTDESVISLGELYRETLIRFFSSLRPGRDGHLVICLPEQTFVGRVTPWFTRRGAYIRLVFALGERFNREVVRIGEVFPSRRRTAGPPYYWQSDRALRRTIVHIVLRPRARSVMTDGPKTSEAEAAAPELATQH